MRADEASIAIRIDPGEPYSARVRITFAREPADRTGLIWFLDEFGPMRGLTERVSRVGLIDLSGRKIAERKIRGVDRIHTRDLSGVEYRIALRMPTSSFAAVHISWLAPDGGILMLDDLVPQGIGKEAVVHLALPTGWKAFGPGIGPGEFRVANVEKTAIRVGSGIRETRARTPSGEIRLGMTGEAWLFSEADAGRMAAAIMEEYGRLFGNAIGTESTVTITPFPFEIAIGNWEGDTRGRSVTIFSSDMPFKNQSLQRLHEQLRHEIFHLWIPNGVNLTGRYDWFYEGFALYQSLRTGVELNQLRFEDYLDTLSRAYDIDAAASPRTTLLDATRERWNGQGTQVYARGMLVAFLCDLILLNRSKGKLSASALVKDVFTTHRTGDAVNGNTAVLAILQKHPELRSVIDDYVAGSKVIGWGPVVAAAGLTATRNGGSTVLAVDPKASGSAKKMLERLGVDNWRRNNKR